MYTLTFQYLVSGPILSIRLYVAFSGRLTWSVYTLTDSFWSTLTLQFLVSGPVLSINSCCSFWSVGPFCLYTHLAVSGQWTCFDYTLTLQILVNGPVCVFTWSPCRLWSVNLILSVLDHPAVTGQWTSLCLHSLCSCSQWTSLCLHSPCSNWSVDQFVSALTLQLQLMGQFASVHSPCSSS